MNSKVQGYGKKRKQNVAILMQQLHISTPQKTHTKESKVRTSKEIEVNDNATRPPLVPVDTNRQRKKKEEKATGRARKPKRKSLLPNAKHEIKAVDLEIGIVKHLQPLLNLTDVNSKVLDFESWAFTWSNVCHLDKIAHGAYGAVYRMESKTQPGVSTIGKLIPLQARSGWGSKTKQFTNVKAAANEVFFSSTLDEINGFVQFRKAEVLYGRLPNPLAAASIAFDARSCDNIPTRFPQACKYEKQFWLFIEMSDAGIDLETALQEDVPGEGASMLQKASNGDKHLSAVQVRDIFWQVASAIAVAEKKLEFEHRDLHLGNICLLRPLSVVEDNSPELWTDNPCVLVTIIDYSISRAKATNVPPIFQDLSDDPELFTGEGHSQYEVYRQMRAVAQRQVESWKAYMPFTNVLWLHHLLEMLLEKTSMIHQKAEHIRLWQRLSDLKATLGNPQEAADFNSAQDVVCRCEMEISE
ncbi:MAG: hypothetical protein Q9182_004904 [Xanthomendoza sp. 2 TL-2023]